MRVLVIPPLRSYYIQNHVKMNWSLKQNIEKLFRCSVPPAQTNRLCKRVIGLLSPDTVRKRPDYQCHTAGSQKNNSLTNSIGSLTTASHFRARRLEGVRGVKLRLMKKFTAKANRRIAFFRRTAFSSLRKARKSNFEKLIQQYKRISSVILLTLLLNSLTSL